MRMYIQICSYAKDVGWCRYALRSIKKYARGFSGVRLVVPAGDFQLFSRIGSGVSLCPIKQIGYPLRGDKPKLHYLIQQCRADEHCSEADFILHMDSDCVFTEPVTPEDYLVQDRPVLLREKFEIVKTYFPGRCTWQPLAEKALGFPVPYDTMVRHPSVHHRWLYREVRERIEHVQGVPFDEYVFAQSEQPLGFTEYPILGAYALQFHADKYAWFEAKSPHKPFDSEKAVGVKEKMRQFQSRNGHGRSELAKVEAELRRIVG